MTVEGKQPAFVDLDGCGGSWETKPGGDDIVRSIGL